MDAQEARTRRTRPMGRSLHDFRMRSGRPASSPCRCGQCRALPEQRSGQRDSPPSIRRPRPEREEAPRTYQEEDEEVVDRVWSRWGEWGPTLLLLSAIGATAEPLAAAKVACSEGVGNGGFEEDADWTLPGTAYPAAYSTAMAHSGERSLRAGSLMTDANVYSYSAANQAIVFPSGMQTDVETGTITATLTVWWWPVTTEAELTRTASAAARGIPLVRRFWRVGPVMSLRYPLAIRVVKARANRPPLKVNAQDSPRKSPQLIG